jgi:hypothetical protein
LGDAAAIVLRGISLDAWNKHHDMNTALAANQRAIQYAVSEALKQRLAEEELTLRLLRPLAGLTPISSAPSLRTVNGTGFTLYGCTDTDVATGSYLTTYYFVVVGIPIFPISRYRVTRTGDLYRFFGKAPLRPSDKWHRAISIGLIVSSIIYVSLCGCTSTSSNRTYYAPSPSWSTSPYSLPHTSDGGTLARNPYRVPTSVSTTLMNEKLKIELERVTLDALEATIQVLEREIERDRLYVDRTSQYAIAEFNGKVARYNALVQQAQAANAALRAKVSNYNAALQRYAR